MKKPRIRKRMNVYLSAKASVIAARLERRKEEFNFSEYFSRKIIVDFSSPQTTEDKEAFIKAEIAQLNAEKTMRDRLHEDWNEKAVVKFESFSSRLQVLGNNGGKK